MFTLYTCQNCQNQYVVRHETIKCPHCDSKDRELQGEFTREDINKLLLERKELQEQINSRK